jgi:hypothetical protein
MQKGAKMTLQEVLLKTQHNDKLVFGRSSHSVNGKWLHVDAYRENFKGRINFSNKYEAYVSVSFHCDSLRATDWVFISEGEII